MLFLLYINDINNAIKSQIKLFADDSVLYRNIRNQNDQVILQNDLDTISSWVEKWLMELNINKCSVLSITLKRNSIFHEYNILGATIGLSLIYALLLKYWKNLFYPKFLPTSTLTTFTILVNQHIVQVTALKQLF